MKKSILLSITLLLTSGIALAQEITKQEKGYFNITELGFFIVQNTVTNATGSASAKNDAHANSIRNINGLFINNNISLGIGVGLDGHSFNNNRYKYDNTFLLFADARYYLKNTSNTFFVFGDFGSSVAIADNFAKGLMFNTGTGYKFKVAKHTALNASVGYNHQGINHDTGGIKEKYSGLSLKIGLLL